MGFKQEGRQILTFNQLYVEAQNQTQDVDTTLSLPLIKRAINQGMRKFGATMNRDWRLREQTFSTVASQQFYQMPEDAIRIKTLIVTVGSNAYPVEEIANEDQWQSLNIRVQTGSWPRYFFVKGNDQFGVWPTPAAIYTGTLSYEHSMRDMAQDDYSTGTVSMTNGLATVTGTSTVWTASMVGRTLFVTDGSADGMGYKIASFTDATHLTLENYYAGTTGGSKTYLIGEVPDIPEEFHESLIDYALYRYYRMRRDIPTSKEMKATFDEALLLCQENYSSKTASQYVRSPRTAWGYYNYPNTNRSI